MNKKNGLKISVIEFFIAGGTLLISIIFFLMIADEVVLENKDWVDMEIFKFVSSHTSTVHTNLAIFFTYFGSPYFLIPAYLIIMLYYWRLDKKKEAILIGVIALISVLSIIILKDIFHRQRPLLPLIAGVTGYSFPSGHSLSGFTFSGMMIYLIFKSSFQVILKWLFSFLLIFLALLIGLSRIYLRVHYPSDVIAALLLTSVWLSLTFIVITFIDNKIMIQSRA